MGNKGKIKHFVLQIYDMIWLKPLIYIYLETIYVYILYKTNKNTNNALVLKYQPSVMVCDIAVCTLTIL